MTTGFHIDEIYLRHRNPAGHPERGERIARLLELAGRADELGVRVLPAHRQATADELALAHEREYVDAILATAGRSVVLDPDTMTSPESVDVARYAVGGVLDLVDRVLAGDLANAFAAVRPPGHHAESDRAMGFCLFNTVAVAARYALEQRGLARVMVIDWDVHHGNGTQEIFWNDDRVQFVSMHQFPFYPGTGSAHETGGEAARGGTVNIPMHSGFGDDEWVAALHRVVVPVARAFAPELVLVSAGFDAHARDPLGGMRMTERGFAAMADAVVSLADELAGRRLVMVLEGGYDVDALGASVEAVLRRMAGSADAVPAGDPGDFDAVLARVRASHADHWQL